MTGAKLALSRGRRVGEAVARGPQARQGGAPDAAEHAALTPPAGLAEQRAKNVVAG